MSACVTSRSRSARNAAPRSGASTARTQAADGRCPRPVQISCAASGGDQPIRRRGRRRILPCLVFHPADDPPVHGVAILRQLSLGVAIERRRPPVERALVAVGSEQRRGIQDRVEDLGGRAETIVEIQHFGQPDLQLDAFTQVERPRVEVAERGPGLLRDPRARPSDDTARAGSGRSPVAPMTTSPDSLRLPAQLPAPDRIDRGCSSFRAVGERIDGGDRGHGGAEHQRHEREHELTSCDGNIRSCLP